MNKKEVVVCAAVEFETSDGKDVIMCLEYKDDFRIDAHRYLLSYYYREDEYNEVKGFITNNNRFILPEEALLITGRQNEMRFQNRKYLLPEDLY